MGYEIVQCVVDGRSMFILDLDVPTAGIVTQYTDVKYKQTDH